MREKTAFRGDECVDVKKRVSLSNGICMGYLVSPKGRSRVQSLLGWIRSSPRHIHMSWWSSTIEALLFLVYSKTRGCSQ